jgi:hypothetical protein
MIVEKREAWEALGSVKIKHESASRPPKSLSHPYIDLDANTTRIEKDTVFRIEPAKLRPDQTKYCHRL